MPDGVVQWFDSATGEGRILHAGRRYAVDASDIEPAARVTGAPVHFDVGPRGEGDRAENVILREGTRSSRRQRRFGDLTGARAPDSKGAAPFSGAEAALGRDLQQNPVRVAELWADRLAAGDLDDLARLYAPDAALHAAGEVHIGPSAVRRHWAGSPRLGGEPAAVFSTDGEIGGRWLDEEASGATAATVTRLVIAHGEIVEQWVGEVWPAAPESEAGPPIDLSAERDVTEHDRRYALEKVDKVLDTTGEPVLHVEIRLERSANPAQERPAKARVTVDLNGWPVRAQVSAPTMHEAIDAVADRLKDRLGHHLAHRLALRHRGPATPAGEWRHGDWAPERPPSFPRPAEEREVVRHKTFGPAACTIDEAVFDLESMDYDVHLFTDLGSGRDGVVERSGTGTYRLRRLPGASGDDEVATVAAIELDPTPVPVLTLDEARAGLDHDPDPWVFFEDAQTGRGRLLYRRYDGHYGLITPAGDGPPV